MRTEQEVKEIIELLAKQNWVFNGFDRSNLEFVFMREDKTWIDCVAIGCGWLGTSRRRKSNKMPFYEFEPFSFNRWELPLFYDLYNFITETRRGLPLDMAKRQKELDRIFKWECGETYCTFENGVLSCGVIKEEEDENL
jgi:hypothetical protein